MSYNQFTDEEAKGQQVENHDESKMIVDNTLQQINTLDEPVSTTVYRDLKMIVHKLSYVVLPRFKEEKGAGLRNWDLWGPLLICLTLALVLSLNQPSQANAIFVSVFTLVWVGSFVVSINAKFLGGDISILQSLCVLGYCLFPICISTIINVFLSFTLPGFIKLAFATVAFLWSTTASMSFMGALMPPDKKVLAIYPLGLFYLFLAWFGVLV